MTVLCTYIDGRRKQIKRNQARKSNYRRCMFFLSIFVSLRARTGPHQREKRYIEASKTRIGSFAAGQEAEDAEARARSSRRTLVYVFDTCLRLLHPFMPFVTEALWQQLPRRGEALMVAPWPKVDDMPLAVDESAINRCL